MNHAPPASTPGESPLATPGIVQIHAGAIADDAGELVGASMLVEVAGAEPLGAWITGRTDGDAPPGPAPVRGELRILAIDRSDRLRHHPAWGSARRLDLSDAVVIPGMVNAHTHLDLTHVGPRPFDPRAGFAGWIDEVRVRRHTDEATIAESVRAGVARCLQGGVIAAGDIGGCPRGGPTLVPWRTLTGSPLRGVSFLEFFAIGTREQAGVEAMERVLTNYVEREREVGVGRVRLGLQPHAPNTVSIAGYRRALELAAAGGMPVATHLAESPAEREFVGFARGPFRDLLESLGLWNDAAARDLGHGRSPVRHLADVIRGRSVLLAHVNDASDDDLDLLAACGARVAYCPRASAYFGNPAHFGPHRYREMLARGIPVALGTDSIINLPADEVRRSGLGVLDEIRLLHRRDGTPPLELLAMCTTHGAAALGLDPNEFRLRTGNTVAGLCAVPCERGPASLTEALRSVGSPRLLLVRK